MLPVKRTDAPADCESGVAMACKQGTGKFSQFSVGQNLKLQLCCGGIELVSTKFWLRWSTWKYPVKARAKVGA